MQLAKAESACLQDGSTVEGTYGLAEVPVGILAEYVLVAKGTNRELLEDSLLNKNRIRVNTQAQITRPATTQETGGRMAERRVGAIIDDGTTQASLGWIDLRT